MRFGISIDQRTYDLELDLVDGRWRFRMNGREGNLDCVPVAAGLLSIVIDGKSFLARRETGGHIWIGSRRYEALVEDARSWQNRKRRDLGQSGPQRLMASMPGKVVRVLAHEGEKIVSGQGIVVIEAMKMQNEIKSPKTGTLQKLLVRTGDNVNAGENLAVVE